MRRLRCIEESGGGDGEVGVETEEMGFGGDGGGGEGEGPKTLMVSTGRTGMVVQLSRR